MHRLALSIFFAYFLTNKSIIYRKSVLLNTYFYRKSVFFVCLFYRKSVFFEVKIYRKSVICVWYVAGF
jgi:hypothetical protein